MTTAGRTVQGRDIDVFVRAVDAPRRRVLVIGGVHGNEPVTPPAVRGLLSSEIAPDVEVWLVPVANPDGSAAGVRCNANGVDLNRNFPWEWDPSDGGPAPLSEPETQALVALVEQLHPDLVIWLHQPLGYVSAIGPTSAALEQAYSAAARLPVRPDVTQHGGGESWSALVAGVPSLLVEIDGWDATPELVDRDPGRRGSSDRRARLGQRQRVAGVRTTVDANAKPPPKPNSSARASGRDAAVVPPLGEPERDAGGRRVAGLDDIGDDDAARHAELLGERLDDPQVGLVGDEHVDVGDVELGQFDGPPGVGGPVGERPAVDGPAVLGEGVRRRQDPDGVRSGRAPTPTPPARPPDRSTRRARTHPPRRPSARTSSDRPCR